MRQQEIKQVFRAPQKRSEKLFLRQQGLVAGLQQIPQAPPEFSSTHPNPGTRIQNLTALMPKAMAYRQKFCEEATP